VAATLASGEAARALTKGTHGTTYGGNPLACAIAGAVLDEVMKPEITENIAARHDQIVAHLEGITEATGLFGDIRAFGLLVGAEMAPDYEGRAKEVQVAALAEGVITLIAGANVLRIAPALNIAEAEVDAGFARLATAAGKVTGT
jgi:acetylornithine/succinyldiaminopimelate/putrescine aminotransferase